MVCYSMVFCVFFFFKQKTAYEMRISDWSSDVCSSDLTSPAAVKEYLRAKLAGFEHEVFAVLFMDTQHRLIEYAEMFRGTIDGASVYPRELVKEIGRASCRERVCQYV